MSTRTSGFTAERAAPHEEFVRKIVAELKQRGYKPTVMPTEGNRPDIGIHDWVRNVAAWVDPKTRYEHHENYAVKAGSLETYWLLTLKGAPVYIVWWPDFTVDTVFTLTPRIIGGPERPTGSGSNTDWVKVKPGGTAFDTFFVSAIADPCVHCGEESGRYSVVPGGWYCEKCSSPY